MMIKLIHGEPQRDGPPDEISTDHAHDRGKNCHQQCQAYLSQTAHGWGNLAPIRAKSIAHCPVLNHKPAGIVGEKTPRHLPPAVQARDPLQPTCSLAPGLGEWYAVLIVPPHDTEIGRNLASNLIPNTK